MALETCRECSREISDQASACPHCGCPRGAEPVSAQSVARKAPAVRGWLVVVAIINLVAIALFVAWVTNRTPGPERKVQSDDEQPANGQSPAADPASSPRVATRAEVVAGWKSLSEAIMQTVPTMEDTTDAHSDGTLSLAAWALGRLKMSELSAIGETTRGKILKDAASARGLRLCVSGRISQIGAVHSDIGTLYEGGLLRNYSEVTRFLAAGDTGELVEGSSARFCGVVTGIYSYANTGGGTTIAPMLVGLFDLPSNR